MLTSTNDSHVRVPWKQAVISGLAADGGLYLPTEFPRFDGPAIARLRSCTFPELAFEIARLFLDDEIESSALKGICDDAFSFPVPLVALDDSSYVLELFHGPTCAFKDFGARFMARLFRHFLEHDGRRHIVLVATSGDTGSAVAQAFFDDSQHPPIEVVILFPRGKVSPVQECQMTTLGHNVTAVEVDGSFDDCQRLVKAALADRELAVRLHLTSANSINIARLLPQSMYYFYAALQMCSGALPVFSVPSGNLGNITGGLVADLLGMPCSKFIAACNANDPFPAYLRTGHYAPRASIETISNAMDVGAPSNIARIFSLFPGGVDAVRSRMSGYTFDDTETRLCITETFTRRRYVVDPHTAVGLSALEAYRKENSSSEPGIVLATAHPGKFGSAVTPCIGREPDLPSQLQQSLSLPSSKVSLSSNFGELKSLLQR